VILENIRKIFKEIVSDWKILRIERSTFKVEKLDSRISTQKLKWVLD